MEEDRERCFIKVKDGADLYIHIPTGFKCIPVDENTFKVVDDYVCDYIEKVVRTYKDNRDLQVNLIKYLTLFMVRKSLGENVQEEEAEIKAFAKGKGNCFVERICKVMSNISIG